MAKGGGSQTPPLSCSTQLVPARLNPSLYPERMEKNIFFDTRDREPRLLQISGTSWKWITPQKKVDPHQKRWGTYVVLVLSDCPGEILDMSMLISILLLMFSSRNNPRGYRICHIQSGTRG